MDESAILGRKTSKYNMEYLVIRSAVNNIPPGCVEDKISIDRIMILYGRKDNGCHKSAENRPDIGQTVFYD